MKRWYGGEDLSECMGLIKMRGSEVDLASLIGTSIVLVPLLVIP